MYVLYITPAHHIRMSDGRPLDSMRIDTTANDKMQIS